MLDKIRANPALVLGFVGSTVALVMAFGLHLSPEQVGAVMAFVSAGLGILTWTQVSPTSTVVAQVVDGQVVAGPAFPAVNGTPVEVTPTIRFS